MAYATIAQVINYLGIDEEGDHVLLDSLINSAQKAIENHTFRTFEAATETRYFEESAVDDDTNTLYVDRDLLTITTLTNGDSSSTAIPNTEYWLVPRNESPKWGIRLKFDSDYSWEFDTDYWVSVAGTWGYSATVPADIVHATKRLVGYYYAQKDAQIWDTTVIPDAGVITVPQGIPRDVERILRPYVRIGAG